MAGRNILVYAASNNIHVTTCTIMKDKVNQLPLVSKKTDKTAIIVFYYHNQCNILCIMQMLFITELFYHCLYTVA